MAKIVLKLNGLEATFGELRGNSAGFQLGSFFRSPTAKMVGREPGGQALPGGGAGLTVKAGE